MDWHSIPRKKRGNGVVLVTGLACCWLLFSAVAAEGKRTVVADTPVRQHGSLKYVSVDLPGAAGGRQWASDPQWSVPAFTDIARQPVQNPEQDALEPAQQPIARLKEAAVWRF
ncbi:Hypothetical protein Achr_24890 [Azotobacter chroococcum NCIMB 8003]|uniref:Uncharacterized protein n=1 Tax=Azotobacter chroococcum NCIMB 8003 TaxID=1328314 RepID=A0A0C4WU30_9GAMM|nr:Hypothetical protein Achr_24890 [Azotobacter chroococcum NCIMB 8003]